MKRLLLLVAALFMVAGIAYGQLGDDCYPADDLDRDDGGSLNGYDSEGGSDDWGTTDVRLCIDSGSHPGPFELGLIVDGERVEIHDGDNLNHVYGLSSLDPVTESYAEESHDTTEDGFVEYDTTDVGGDYWCLLRISDSLQVAQNVDDMCDCGPLVVVPEVSAAITGPHTVGTGTSPVVLTAVAVGFDEDPAVTFEWDDASSGDTRTLVGLGDGAYEYSVTASGNVDAVAETAEAAFTLWVGLATPLAGGLGLGLLAGACALAGVIAIRRKK